MGLGFRIRGRTGGLSFACRLVGVLSVATPVGFVTISKWGGHGVPPLQFTGPKAVLSGASRLPDHEISLTRDSLLCMRVHRIDNAELHKS